MAACAASLGAKGATAVVASSSAADSGREPSSETSFDEIFALGFFRSLSKIFSFFDLISCFSYSSSWSNLTALTFLSIVTRNASASLALSDSAASFFLSVYYEFSASFCLSLIRFASRSFKAAALLFDFSCLRLPLSSVLLSLVSCLLSGVSERSWGFFSRRYKILPSGLFYSVAT